MKNLIYAMLVALNLSGCTVDQKTGQAKPLTFTETYVGQIQDARYVSGGNSSYHQTTIVITENGFFPVYYYQICLKGKNVWISHRSDGESFLKVEGQNQLWDFRN